MMKLIKVCLLAIVSLSLAACSTNFKALSEDYQGQSLETSLNYKGATNIRTPYVQQSHTGGGGGIIGLLVLAAVDTAINVHAANSARDRKKAVSEGMKNFDYEKHVNRPTIATIKKAPWIDVRTVNKNGGYYNAEGAINISKTDFVALASYDFAAINDVSFQSAFKFEVFDKTDKENPIYKINLAEIYNIPGSGAFDGEVQGAWEDNNGALIKEAVIQTTRTINEKLAIYLADPFNRKIQSEIQQMYQSGQNNKQ